MRMIKKKIISVSFPRSGHHVLADCLLQYFSKDLSVKSEKVSLLKAGDLVYCESYSHCNKVPCPNKETNFQKTHDFNLNVKKDLDAKYIIQYRSPLEAIVSLFLLETNVGHKKWLSESGRSNKTEDNKESWEEFAKEKIIYWKNFVRKWILENKDKENDNYLLLDYDSLLNSPNQKIEEVIEFITGQKPDKDFVNKIILAKNIHKKSDIKEFKYYNKDFFDTLEKSVSSELQALKIEEDALNEKIERISIITPSYNRQNTIAQTIESVISQEGNFELEYIIVDGKSTDKTIDIIKKYEQILKAGQFSPKCKKIYFKYILGNIGGPVLAINNGFKMATGQVVNWLGSDDFLQPGALNEVFNFFNQNKKAKIVFGDGEELWDNGKIIYRKGRKFSYADLQKRWNSVYNTFYIMQPSVFFKKYLLESYGYLDPKYNLSFDYELWLRFAEKTNFNYIPKKLSSSSYQAGTISYDNKMPQFFQCIEASKKHWGKKYLFLFISCYFFIYVAFPFGRLLKKLGFDADKIFNFFYK